MKDFYNNSDRESGCYYPEDVNDEKDKENYVPSSSTKLARRTVAEITAFIKQQRPKNTTNKKLNMT